MSHKARGLKSEKAEPPYFFLWAEKYSTKWCTIQRIVLSLHQQQPIMYF